MLRKAAMWMALAVIAGVGCKKVAQDLQAGKTTEAAMMLKKVAAGAKQYYMEANSSGGSIAPAAPRFPTSAPLTPASDCCAQGGRCSPDPTAWAEPTWSALSFSMDDPHFFQYEFISSGTGDEATFTARAVGRPGCEGDPVTYEVTGKVSGGKVEISGP